MSYNVQMLDELKERIEENGGRTQDALITSFADAKDGERKAMEVIWFSNDDETTDEMWQDIFELVDVDFNRTVKSDLKRLKALREF